MPWEINNPRWVWLDVLHENMFIRVLQRLGISKKERLSVFGDDSHIEWAKKFIGERRIVGVYDKID